MEARYDVIIIGAGIGGLTCGAALAKAGRKVLICEQNPRPGGYVTSFKRKGFIFDGGLQSFTSSGIVFHILKQLGLYDKVRFARADYRIITPDINIKLNSLPQVSVEFKRAFPQAQSELEGYFNEIKTLVKPFQKMYGKPVPPLLSGFRKALTMLSFPITNLGFVKNVRQYEGKTSLDLIDRHITDSRPRHILRSLGYPVMSAMMTGGMWYSWLDDYWYPIGGMQKFANLFANLVEENGSTISLGTKVDQVIVGDGMAKGVKLVDGREIHSKFVVSNVDWKQTFATLIKREYLDEQFVARIEKAAVSESMFCVYLGTDLDPSLFEGLAHHIFYFPAYGPSFPEKDINDPDFFKRCGMEISIPSIVDDSLAPQGKSVVTLTTFAPYDYLGRWKTEGGQRTEAYRRLKEKVADQLIATAEGVIPDLSKHIVVKEIATPLTYERYTLNTHGASVGWNWNPRYALTKEYASSVGSLRTPIKNLFTVGHWSYSPGALPPAMLTGKVVAHTIQRH